MPRSMEIDTPLGADVLLFHRMHAREELSRSSDFELELLSDPKNTINFDDILGQNVTVRVTLQDDSTRHFNGFVTRFSAGGRLGRYLRFTATVSPWAWFMTRTSDCRIFQEMTVREILEEVFADHPMADFKFELTESYEKWNYCVQYRETDFNFVSRLMEHEGIYYYYRHIDGGHTMVLTDSIDNHECFPSYDSIKFIRPQEVGRPEIEHISSWEFYRQVQPGVFSLDDYDFARPAVDLRLSRPVPRNYIPSDYEWFEYPGFFTKKKHGEQLAQVRGDEFASQFERGLGNTNARGVHVGSVFKLDGFPREDQNCKHLVVASTHDLEYSEYEAMPAPGGSGFQCKFVAMTTAQQFRPQRLTPKPFVQGPQTAEVVGPAGEEIHTDEYGRVKVQFHWDSRGKRDEQSSCWIRVSQPWAGKGWGSVSTPRIGQEVIVDFLEGDPDQPIITGRVYNADNLPPFGFPAGAVISGMKSDTHKGGGYNEMSFDDTAGKEKITVHGQYDMNTTIEHDETRTVKTGVQTVTVKGDTSLTVQTGNRIVTVESANYELSAAQAVKVYAEGAGIQMTGESNGVTVVGEGGIGVDVTGTPNVELWGDAESYVGAPTTTIEGTTQCDVTAPNVLVNGDAQLIVTSPIIDVGDGVISIHGSQIVLAAAGGGIEIGAAGVTINGTTVTIAGGTINVVGGLVKIN